jgi:putative two-component system response regulator
MARPYKEPWPVEKAFAEIQSGSGQHFDPEIVECFFDIRSELMGVKDIWKAIELNSK